MPSAIAPSRGATKTTAHARTTCAVTTTGSVARHPSSTAPPAISDTAAASSPRLLRAPSTRPPAGICSAMGIRPPTVSSIPSRSGAHPLAARYAARNGPIPVCTSATKKFSHSRARTLPRFDGSGGVFLMEIVPRDVSGSRPDPIGCACHLPCPRSPREERP